VGTVTEIHDYLRLLFARAGRPHCYQCGKEIQSQTIQQIVDQIMALPAGTRLQLFSPIIRGRKGEYRKEFDHLRKSGYARVRVDGEIRDLSEEIPWTRIKSTPSRSSWTAWWSKKGPGSGSPTPWPRP